MKLKELSILQKCSLALAVALLLCLASMPYGYYSVIRLATAIIATCWAITFFNDNKTPLAVVSAGIALLFQPFIKVILDKDTWTVVDVLVAIALIYISLKRQSLKSEK